MVFEEVPDFRISGRISLESFLLRLAGNDMAEKSAGLRRSATERDDSLMGKYHTFSREQGKRNTHQILFTRRPVSPLRGIVDKVLPSPTYDDVYVGLCERRQLVALLVQPALSFPKCLLHFDRLGPSFLFFATFRGGRHL